MMIPSLVSGDLQEAPGQLEAQGRDFVREVICARRAIRAFLPRPVPDPLIRAVFKAAGQAPSNCNTQPWLVEVVSGATRNRLSAALVEAGASQNYTPDFPFDHGMYVGEAAERRRRQGAVYYETMGISREDADGRRKAIIKNLDFFGAPHVAFLFMPHYGTERVALDVGLYAQTLMLAMKAYGVDSCPQTMLGMFGQQVREVLSIAEENKLLLGISFGYGDASASANQIVMPRAALSQTTRFHD